MDLRSILSLIASAGVLGIMFRMVQLGIRRGKSSFYAALYLVLGALMPLSLALNGTMFAGASVQLLGTFAGLPSLGMVIAACTRNAAGPWSVGEQVWFIKFNRLVLVSAPLCSVTAVIAQQAWMDALALSIGAVVAGWPLYRWHQALMPQLQNN